MSRIAMVAYTDYRSDPRVRREAEALTKAGHWVSVFCLEEGGAPPTMVDGVEVVGILAGRYRGGNPLAYVFSYGRFVLAARRALRRYHRQRPFDLVQAHTMPDFVVFSARPLKRAGIPVLLDIHDLMPELFVSKFGLPPRHLVVRLLRWQERCSARFAHRCLAVHRRHRQLLADRSGGVTIDVVHNLPDPRWFPLTAPAETGSEGMRIVYHGTVAHRHGIDVAVKAMHLIHDQFPSARLDVYGDGDAASSIAALIEELSASAYVGFQVGMVPLEQLVSRLQGAGIGVIPMRADTFTNYMLPTKLLEYVAMGVPVISSDLLSVRDYFSERQVRYVKPGDVEDLATAFRQLLSDPNLRRQLAIEAASFYDRYSWSAESRAYLSIVESMIAANAERSDGSVHRQ
jgi:glycosyltransferase involved in cell wall biosynthesis